MTRHSNSSRDSLIPPAVIRQLADQLVSVQTDVDLLQRVSRSTRLGHSSIDDGYLTIRDGDGLPRGYVGIQPDGTSGVRAVNGPPPPRPNTPELTGIMDGILVSWNGTFADTRPLDFAFLNVYVSGAGPSFIEGPSNLVTQFTEAGDFPVTNLGVGTYWCRFVAYNTSGKASEPSLTASATSLQVVAQDILDGIVTTTKLAADAVTAAKLAANAVTATKIADDSISSPKIIAGGIQAINLAADSVSAGKIAADAVTAREIAALTITAAEIAANSINTGHLQAGSVTAAKLEATLVLATRVIVGTAAGDRVEIHPTTGFEQWRSGTRTVSIPPTGSITAGQGIGTGSTIVIDPVLVEQSFYPSNTAKRFRFQASTAALVGGGTGPMMDIEAVNASGVERGAFVHMEAVTDTTGLTWIGFTGAGSALQGGRIKLYQADNYAELGNDNCRVSFNGGSGDLTTSGSFTINTNGVTVFSTSGDEFRLETGVGSAMRLFADGTAQLISAGGVKAFVIDHPDDPDRLLVHGCTESPDAAVTYSGAIAVYGHRADVDLPGYFEGLVRDDSRSAEAWVPLSDDLRMFQTAASVPKGGRFHVVSDAPDGTIVHWRVTACRREAGGFDVEPLKSAVRVAGDGPYRYIIPNAA